MDAREAMRAAELGEAEYMFAMFDGASAEDRAALGMAQAHIGGGVVTVMANDPTGGYWSRVIGLGLDEPVTEQVVDEVIGFAREHRGPSLVFQMAPDAEGPWEELFAARGAAAGSAWAKFAAEVPVAHPEAHTDLDIRPLTTADGSDYALIMTGAFGMPEHPNLLNWFADSLGLPGFRGHGGLADAHLVSAAISFSFDGRTALCGAGTTEAARGHGGQSALMVARYADAEAAGSTWVTAETFVETEQSGPNPSLHNMRRMGLTELYDRRNWRWTA